jgi:hypothetical protein
MRKETMTVTMNEASAAANKITVREESGPFSFKGRMIVQRSWTPEEARQRGYTRWTDLTLYESIDKSIPFRWIVQSVARSVVYHTSVSSCGRGTKVLVATVLEDKSLYQSRVACPFCSPPDLDFMEESEMVALEVPRYSLYKCHTAAGFDKVMEDRSRTGLGNGLLNRLVSSACDLNKTFETELMESRARRRG